MFLCHVLFQAINPVLILIFIPVFDYVIYPLLDKCKIPNRYTQTHAHSFCFIGVIFWSYYRLD